MKRLITALALLAVLASCGSQSSYKKMSKSEAKALAETILNDPVMTQVEQMAIDLIKSGYTAGSGYPETWIRDFNTLTELALDQTDNAEIEKVLLTFMRMQGEDGNVLDGYVSVEKGIQANAFLFDSEPGLSGYKNTVETDQESSLILATCKYIDHTGDKSFLQKDVLGMTVQEHLEAAIRYLLTARYDAAHGLLWGCTTADWGDVQPEHERGVLIDENSHLALDIYDNALFISALNAFIGVLEDEEAIKQWSVVRDDFVANVKTYLWDEQKGKYRPHVYVAESPFPDDFDEDAIYYHGGTGVAMEAGLLTKDQVYEAYKAMKADKEAAGANSIGLTLYPTYPTGYFKNPILTKAYTYQNGGDWTWFGARIVTQMAKNGFVAEAYEELMPMLERVVKNNDFHEWYSLEGEPRGSANFRGAAGVLYVAINTLKDWAEENK